MRSCTWVVYIETTRWLVLRTFFQRIHRFSFFLRSLLLVFLFFFLSEDDVFVFFCVACVYRGGELVNLHHRLADGRTGLLNLSNHGGIVEDAAGDLAMATAEAEHEVQGGLLLDVVIREGAAILELLAGEDETLLIRGNALLVLNLGLDVVDGVG